MPPLVATSPIVVAPLVATPPIVIAFVPTVAAPVAVAIPGMPGAAGRAIAVPGPRVGDAPAGIPGPCSAVARRGGIGSGHGGQDAERGGAEQ
jgi:hypothetical protein